MQGQMGLDMFSYRHTLLDEVEKDVVQRSYYNINQILSFLMNPTLWVKRRNVKTFLSDQFGKVKPNQRKD